MRLAPKELIRRARRDVSREYLIETAERVFAERGYEGTRMSDVAAEAGLALGTIYALVDSKEELYAEVHKQRGGGLYEHAMLATGGARSAWEGLLAGVKAYAEYLLQHPNYLKLHLHESQPWAGKPNFTSAPQTKLWRDGLELTEHMFRAAIAEGAVVDENPALLGRLMIAAHQVFLGEWVEAGMKEPTHELVARMQAHVERAFGAGKKKPRSR